MSVTVATFYHFAALPDYAALQPHYKQLLLSHNITGSLLVAPEGINATLAGPTIGIDAVIATLRADARFTGLTAKYSTAPTNPFQRTKVRLKRETIPLGIPVNPAHRGTYVKPEDWNALISNPETITIDTRNRYEVQIGQFKGAQNPNTRIFSQLPEWLEKNLPANKSTPIAMYCTGGIRCEKSTAFLTQQGYHNVYHLEGGILKYLEEIPPEQSLWQGACYVFDDRVAVDHHLQPVPELQVCQTCNSPIIAAELRRMDEHKTTCPHCPT